MPKLVVLKSDYRFIIRPILNCILQIARENPGRRIVVVIPELVEMNWFHRFLHNHRSAVLKALLLFQGDGCIAVVNIPWYLK